MNTDEATLTQITERIIGCAYRVASKLGTGFLENCYENALAYELRRAGLRVQQQVQLQARYDDIVVGEYIADLIAEESIIVELKAIQALEAIHAAQCINCLAATGLPLCLLINFGRRVQVKRIAGPTLIPRSASSVPVCAPSVAEPGPAEL